MRNPSQRASAHIGADVPLAMRAAVDAAAKRHGVTVSIILRWALTAYLPTLQDGPAAPAEQAS